MDPTGALASAGVFGTSAPLFRGVMDTGNQVPAIDSTDDDNPLFATNDFRMLYMKVLPCAKRYTHDWTVCPFSHTGEKARRRDPRLFNYTGIACPDMKRSGNCIRGDRCPYAHNVFEYWLHPTRYRTQLCNDGQNCTRRVCFFAHTLDEVRVPKQKPYVSPEALAAASLEAIAEACQHAPPPPTMGGPEPLLPPAGGLYKTSSCPNGAMQLQPMHSMPSGGVHNPFARAQQPMLSQALHGQRDVLGDLAPKVDMSVLSYSNGLSMQHPTPLTTSSPTSAASFNVPTASSTSPAGDAADQDLLASLASIRSALASGKLQQQHVLRLLGDMSLGEQPTSTESGSGGSAAMAAADDDAARRSKSASPGPEVPPGVAMEQPGLGMQPAGPSVVLPSPANVMGRLWHTSSAPVVAGGVPTTLLGPAGVMGQSQLPPPDWGTGAGLPSLSEGLYPAPSDSLHQRVVLEELLQQSAATQSSAAANGQASRQAKLAKASSLTTWLNNNLKESS